MLALTLSRAAQLHGHRQASLEVDSSLSWGELRDRVARIAAGLRASPLQAGDRVAVLARNGSTYLETYFALAWAGLVITPLNPRATGAELSFCLADSGATAIIHDETNAAMARAVADELSLQRISMETDFARLAATAPMQPFAAAWDDLAGLFYTGGTTGQAKGVMLSHGNLLFNAQNSLIEFGYGPDTVYLHAAPMFHLADGASNFALTLAGAAHAFLSEFTIPGLIAAIKQYSVNYIVLVPTMVQRLLDHPDLDSSDLSSLRTIAYGAAPMPEETLRRAMQLLPDCAFVQAYGMTELSPVAAILSREDHLSGRPRGPGAGAAGRATFGVELRIVDKSGIECARGEVGEVIVRGPTLMKGYWKRPELTAEAIRDGWMHTGDLARMDDNGYIYIEDRLKDMIITGGENVYSAEVENALCTHPDIAQCAVIGVPSQQWGEAVHAVVVTRPGRHPHAQDLIAHCRARLPAFKCPKSLEFREALPLTGAGKVQKAELRRPHWANVSRGVN